jgi:hypothetical protein
VPGRRTLGAALLLAVALFLAQALYRLARPQLVDDAYMVLRYAKHLAAGDGIAWNPGGPATFGVTGTLHLGLVALLRAATPLGDERVLALASLLFALAALGALAAVGAALVRGRLREHRVQVALGLVLFLLPQQLFLSHALAGMDAMSSLGANVLVGGAALWLARGGGGRALAACAGAGALALLARPDNGLFAVLTPALALAFSRTEPRRTRRLFELGAALAFALGALALLAAAVFGDPLPLPFYAKRLGYLAEYGAAGAWNPFEYLGQIVAMWLPALALVVLYASRRSAGEIAALLAPVALTFAYYFGVVQIMGMGARYYVPATPFVALAALVALDDRIAELDAPGALARGLATRWPWALALAVALPTLLHDAELAYGRRVGASNPMFPSACYERPATGALGAADYDAVIAGLSRLAADLPPGTRLALSEHGRIGAAAPQVALDDLVALHDPAFAHDGFDPEVELARKPDAIWLPHYHYVALWHELAAHPRLWQEYEVWPDALIYGFAIRRDGPQRERLRAGFAELFARLYPGEDLEAWRATRLRSERPECRRESRVGVESANHGEAATR